MTIMNDVNTTESRSDWRRSADVTASAAAAADRLPSLMQNVTTGSRAGVDNASMRFLVPSIAAPSGGRASVGHSGAGIEFTVERLTEPTSPHPVLRAIDSFERNLLDTKSVVAA